MVSNETSFFQDYTTHSSGLLPRNRFYRCSRHEFSYFCLIRLSSVDKPYDTKKKSIVLQKEHPYDLCTLSCKAISVYYIQVSSFIAVIGDFSSVQRKGNEICLGFGFGLELFTFSSFEDGQNAIKSIGTSTLRSSLSILHPFYATTSAAIRATKEAMAEVSVAALEVGAFSSLAFQLGALVTEAVGQKI